MRIKRKFKKLICRVYWLPVKVSVCHYMSAFASTFACNKCFCKKVLFQIIFFLYEPANVSTLPDEQNPRVLFTTLVNAGNAT